MIDIIGTIAIVLVSLYVLVWLLKLLLGFGVQVGVAIAIYFVDREEPFNIRNLYNLTPLVLSIYKDKNITNKIYHIFMKIK